MENAMWKGQLLTASEVAEDYVLEKLIRKASGHKELLCSDPECQNPILRYCHGEIKDAYFAHLDNEHCDYADFDRQNTQVIRSVRRKICEQLEKKGFMVKAEVKILEHHYTHLFVDMGEDNKIAIEIGTQRTTANGLDKLTEEYHKKGIAVKWIVVDNTEVNVKEKSTYFLKRYLFNESKNKDLLVVSWDGREAAQYKTDPNQYIYYGYNMAPSNYSETYYELSSIEELTIENGELTLEGYLERYINWIINKQEAFNEKIARLEERIRVADEYRRKTVESKQSAFKRHQENAKKEEQDISFERYREEIVPLINQQEKTARDSLGRRWIKCEKCGRIDLEDSFYKYGGPNHVNLGICYDCSGIKRPAGVL